MGFSSFSMLRCKGGLEGQLLVDALAYLCAQRCQRLFDALELGHPTSVRLSLDYCMLSLVLYQLSLLRE